MMLENLNKLKIGEQSQILNFQNSKPTKNELHVSYGGSITSKEMLQIEGGLAVGVLMLLFIHFLKRDSPKNK
ncbi:MAG: hypothetical protein V4449_03030 [Patescibacteria group bacterium]